jgi:hypothetical protein
MTITRILPPRGAFRRLATAASLSLFAILAIGCANVNRLHEAQTAFNQAAAAENTLRFDTKASDAVASLGAVRGGYASALISLDQLENSKAQTQLRKDGLWGTALTLKALSQWRLGQVEKALTTALLASQSAGDQLYPRDRAVITALPGLIKTDQAYAKIFSNAPLSEVKALLVDDNGAVANIERARLQTDKDHPVQVYLIQAQLAAYRNYVVAVDRLKNHASVAADDPARLAANRQLKELDRLLKAQSTGPSLVEYWVRVATLDRP